jgi:hypothetical protein
MNRKQRRAAHGAVPFHTVFSDRLQEICSTQHQIDSLMNIITTIGKINSEKGLTFTWNGHNLRATINPHRQEVIIRLADEGEMALMTVRLHMIDENKTVNFGGPADQAEELAARLAAEFNVPKSGDNMLQLRLSNDDIVKRVLPILKEYPGIGWIPARKDPGEILRDARPEMADVLRYVFDEDGEVEELERTEEPTDWSFLKNVKREGFDPEGVLGPTYYRVTDTHYYSVFFNPQTGEPHLIMSELHHDDAQIAAIEEWGSNQWGREALEAQAARRSGRPFGDYRH